MMKVEFDLEKRRCVVTAEGKEKFYKESALWHAIKKELIKQGHDVIKKCPDKDGHMTSAPYYIRQRKWDWCVFDWHHEIKALNETFNREREVKLTVHSGDRW
jgi:hypothetical protein